VNENQRAKIAAIQRERDELLAVMAREHSKSLKAMQAVGDKDNPERKQFEAEEAGQVAQLKSELREENMSYESLMDFAAIRAVRLMSATQALAQADEMLEARDRQFWALNHIIDTWIFVAEAKTRFIAVADNHDDMKALAERGHPDAKELVQSWSKQGKVRGEGGHYHQRQRGTANRDAVLAAWRQLNRTQKTGPQKAAVIAIEEILRLQDVQLKSSAISNHLANLKAEGLLHTNKPTI